MIRIGIDEAGYGPLLGPLVLGAAGFRVVGDGSDLRERLDGIVCRAAGRRPRQALPVAVDDSKEVHARWGLEGLARGVAWAAVGARRAAPADLADWLERFADRPPSAFAADPWHAAPERARIPVWDAPPGLAERLRLRGVEPLGILVAPVRVQELNEAFDAVGNKARVLFLASAALLVRALAEWGGDDAEVVFDRQGGRLDYAGPLASVFPFHEVRREAAPEGEARYRLTLDGRGVLLRFVTKGDRADLATGLASMAAKLTRELFVQRMNAWFAERVPGVRPTAGYPEDGRRFLGEVRAVLGREGISDRAFVRSR